MNLEALQRRFGERMMAPIHRATVLRECAALGHTIFEHSPDHRAAKEYAQVVWAMLQEVGYGR